MAAEKNGAESPHQKAAEVEDPPGEIQAGTPLSGEEKKVKPADPLVGRVVNERFRIVAPIARGGMGKVYRAEQAPLGRQIALKVLHPNYSGDSDPEFHKRFFLEASISSKLTHPNTVTIFDYGRTDDDIYYIAMELLEGTTLHRVIRKEGPVEYPRAMHIARQICRSLREAHGLGVIHRDLKPANVFLVEHGDESDFVKVLDFGLVKDLGATGEDLTQTGLFMGSPKYMAPEQIRGEKVDPRVDIYALGVMLYEMITGKVPFDRSNSVNILMAHVHEAPSPMREVNPDVEIPPLIEAIVMKAMAKLPEERFASMDEMLVALKHGAMESGLALSRSIDLRSTGSGDYPTVTTGDHRVVSGLSVPTTDVQQHGVGPASGQHDTNKRPVALFLTMLAILGLVAAVSAALIANPSTENTEDVSPPEAVAVAPPQTITPPVEPPPVQNEIGPITIVNIYSDPAGATVFIDDQEAGTTPMGLEWDGEDAIRGRRVNFRFVLEGHRDYPVTRIVRGDQLDVNVRLERMRQQRPRPRTRRPERPSSGRANGYKLDPY